MKLTVVRHTTVKVLPGTCYGQTDVDVADTFEYEKDRIVSSLRNSSFSKVYSSPLKRCQKLARAISGSGEIICDHRLAELNFGKWEGLLWKDIEQTEEAQWWFEDYVNRPCPEGESYKDLFLRVSAFICALEVACPVDDNILIVTHGGVIRVLFSLLKSVHPNDTFSIDVDYGTVFEFKV